MNDIDVWFTNSVDTNKQTTSVHGAAAAVTQVSSFIFFVRLFLYNLQKFVKMKEKSSS